MGKEKVPVVATTKTAKQYLYMHSTEHLVSWCAIVLITHWATSVFELGKLGQVLTSDHRRYLGYCAKGFADSNTGFVLCQTKASSRLTQELMVSG